MANARQRRPRAAGLAVIGIAAIAALGFGVAGERQQIFVAMAVGTLALIDYLMRPRAAAVAVHLGEATPRERFFRRAQNR